MQQSLVAIDLIAPVLAALLAAIVGYALRRIHLIRIIYTDVDYRMRFATLRLAYLMQWIASASGKHASGTVPELSLPFLRTSAERHHVYPSLQDDMRKCLWGNEVATVRLFYRAFEEAEGRAEKIDGLYRALCEELLDPSRTSEEVLQIYRFQIEENTKIIRGIVNFWQVSLCSQSIPEDLQALNRSIEQGRVVFTKAAHQLLYEKRVWYPVFFFIPLLLVLILLYDILSPVGLSSYLKEYNIPLSGSPGGAFVVLLVGLMIVAWLVGYAIKYYADAKLESLLKRVDSRLREFLPGSEPSLQMQAKKPPSGRRGSASRAGKGAAD